MRAEQRRQSGVASPTPAPAARELPVGAIATESEPSVLVVTVAVALPAPIAVFSAVCSAVWSAAAPPAPDQSAPVTETVLNAPPSSRDPELQRSRRALVARAGGDRARDRADDVVDLIAQASSRRRRAASGSPGCTVLMSLSIPPA